MTETLEDLLAEARARLIEKEDRQDREIEELQQLHADNEKWIMKLACDMLPEPVREYVQMSSHDDSYHTFMISLPGNVAPILMDVYASYDGQGNVDKVVPSSQGIPWKAPLPYRVSEYVKYLDEDEGIYKLGTRNLAPFLTSASFDEVLMDAIREGNNKAAVEQEIQAANHKLALEVGIEIKETVLQCPLSIMVEGEQGDCVGSRCAWWIAELRGKGGCAVVQLGRVQARADE